MTHPMDPLPENFVNKVELSGDCWIWKAATSGGYGRFWPLGESRGLQAHRFSYEAMRAPIPEGLVLDHLCRNQHCVNPWHVEPVTTAENVRRGLRGRMVTVCKHGHPYTPESTYIKPNGTRRCIICNNALRRRRSAERRAAASAVSA